VSASEARFASVRAPRESVADVIEAERYLTLEEYALVLDVTPRWLENHCGSRFDDVAYSRVGRNLKFSPEDRAENKRRFAVRPREPTDSEPHRDTAPLPTDPADLAKVLANVRRVTAGA